MSVYLQCLAHGESPKLNVYSEKIIKDGFSPKPTGTPRGGHPHQEQPVLSGRAVSRWFCLFQESLTFQHKSVCREAGVALYLFNKTFFYVALMLDLQNIAERGQKVPPTEGPVPFTGFAQGCRTHCGPLAKATG